MWPRGGSSVEDQAEEAQREWPLMATAGGAAMAMLGEAAAAAGAAGENGGGAGGAAAAAGAYGGASRKLEELFSYWLSQKETAEMVEHCVTAVRQGQALPVDPGLEVSDGT